MIRKTTPAVRARENEGGILAFLEEMSRVEGLAGLRFWAAHAMVGGRVGMSVGTGTYVVIFEAPPRGIKFTWDDSILVDRMQPVRHRLGGVDLAFRCQACQEVGHHAGNCADVVPVVSPNPIDFILTKKPTFI